MAAYDTPSIDAPSVSIALTRSCRRWCVGEGGAGGERAGDVGAVAVDAYADVHQNDVVARGANTWFTKPSWTFSMPTPGTVRRR